MAVCLAPGTELAFAEEVAIFSHSLLGWRKKTTGHRTAIFRQLNKDNLTAHHDALEFPDGTTELLTLLCEDKRLQCFNCLHSQASATEAEALTRVAYVG
jgi:hypothetical protein